MTTKTILLIIIIAAIVALGIYHIITLIRRKANSTNWIEQFSPLFDEINKQMLEGKGEIVRPHNPQRCNLWSESRPNLLIQIIFHAPDHIEMVMRYRHLGAETAKGFAFRNLLDADNATLLDIANLFVNRSNIAIDSHIKNTNAQHEEAVAQGNMTDLEPDSYDKTDISSIELTPQSLAEEIRGMLTTEQKIAALNAGRMVFTADGSPASGFKSHPSLAKFIDIYNINLEEADAEYARSAEIGVIATLTKAHDEGIDITPIQLIMFEFTREDMKVNIVKFEKLHQILSRAGYTDDEMSNALVKVASLLQILFPQNLQG